MSKSKGWDEIKPVRPVPLHRMILEQLHDLMLRGQLKAGQLLPSERVLAEKMQVSRGTLREAFCILEYQGILETRAGGGRRLRSPSINERSVSPEEYVRSLQHAAAVDLMEARQALEKEIVELACLRATPEDLEAIRNALDASFSTSNEDGVGDEVFHLAIAAATHNFVFVNMMRLHLDLVKGIRQMILTDERRMRMREEHEAIYGAIAAGDCARAREAMIQHRDKVIDLLRQRLERPSDGAS